MFVHFAAPPDQRTACGHRIVPERAMRLVLAAAFLAAFSAQVRAQTCPPGYKSAAGACVQTCPGGYEDRGRICIYRRQGD
jgi:hypothetical protein